MTEKKITIEDVYELVKSLLVRNDKIGEELSLINKQLIERDSIIKEIKNENKVLHARNSLLEKQINVLNRKIRENNLIIFNLPENENAQLIDLVVDFIGKTIGVSLEPQEINNVFRVGKLQKGDKTRQRPVVLKLTTFLKKAKILENVGKLKGTSVSIGEDLSKEDRQKQKVIYEHYRDARSKGYSAKILACDTVLINGNKYKYEDLEKPTEGVNHGQVRRKSYSAPSSPVHREDPFNLGSPETEGRFGTKSKLQEGREQGIGAENIAGTQSKVDAVSQEAEANDTAGIGNVIGTRLRANSKSSSGSTGDKSRNAKSGSSRGKF